MLTHTLETIFNFDHMLAAMHTIREPLHLVKNETTGMLGLLTQSDYENKYSQLAAAAISHIGILPAIYPEWLGEPSFLTTYHTRFPYIVGEMANGIATSQMVIQAARAGMLGFFGAAGLMPDVVEKNILQIKEQIGATHANWGVNLIHTPQEPAMEEKMVDLYLRQQVKCVSASAYMALSLHLVRYACTGLTLDQQGQIVRQNHILAKLSRPEIAKQFLSPAPPEMLQQLVQIGKITPAEAQLAAHVPVAQDITVEADSAGHTDNRPLSALFPTILLLAQQLAQHYQYSEPLRIGAAGGLSTPTAVAAAFSLGAAYVLTGSVNQAAVESGLSTVGKQMLLAAELVDVAMAPAADMFELGVKLQVLKRGTLFSARANKLYELYTRYASLEDIPAGEKNKLETQILGQDINTIWELTREFFTKRDPQQIERATTNPKYRMALVFRWYLGLSSRWAITGTEERKMDYQIWCGPAMGAFNKWIAGTCLAEMQNLTVEQIGRNLLEGAAIITRAQQLRSYGMPVPLAAFAYQPRLLG